MIDDTRRLAMISGERFDQTTQIVTALLNVPVSLVSLIEEGADRQVFLGEVGLPKPWSLRGETPLTHSFCKHVRAQAAPLVVENALLHPIVKMNRAIVDLGVVAYAGVPVFDSEGAAIGALCAIDAQPRMWTAQDVSHLEALAAGVSRQIALRMVVAEREEEDRQKSAFLADMSHEVRTPMNAVIGIADALAMSDLTESQHNLVGIIKKAGGDLLALVNELLDLSKLDTEDLFAEAKPCAPSALLHETVDLFRARAEAAGIDLIARCDQPDGLTVSCNARRIRQALNNLLSNALKFTESGSVTVDLHLSRGNALVFSVADTGPGVPDALKDAIFGRFAQGAHTSSMHAAGIGLGLSIARRICENHGGRLEVSDTPGGGATFTAKFAIRAVEDPAAIHKRTLRVLFAGLPGQHVELRDALRARADVHLVIAESGHEALSNLREAKIDAAIVAVSLPVLTGFECVRATRAIELVRRNRRLPILALSDEEAVLDCGTAHRAGFDDRIESRTAPETVVAALRKLLRSTNLPASHRPKRLAV